MKAQTAEEAEKKALLERLSRPSGLSDDEVMDKASSSSTVPSRTA